MPKNKKGMNPVREKQRFSIRKLSIGAASVLLGFTFVTTQATTVHAADNGEQVQTDTAAKGEDAGNSTAASANSKNDQANVDSNSQHDAGAAQKVKADKPASVSNSQSGTANLNAKTSDKTSVPNTKQDAVSAKSTGEKTNAKPDSKLGTETGKTESAKQNTVPDSKQDTETSKDAKTKTKQVPAAPKVKSLKADAESDSKQEKTTYDVSKFTLKDTNDGLNKYISSYSGDDHPMDQDGNVVLPNTQDFIDAGMAHEGQKVYIFPFKLKQLLSFSYSDPAAKNISINKKASNAANSKLYLTSVAFSGILSNTKADTVDLTGLDTSAVTNMYAMFQNTSNVKNLDITGWDTSNVIHMSDMFNQSYSLESIKGFGRYGDKTLDTSKVTDMSEMFRLCTNLKDLDVTGMNTSNVTDMSFMFLTCSSLSGVLNLSHFDTSKVTSMADMFQATRSLDSVDLSSFNTQNVDTFAQMFNNSGAKTLDLSSFTFNDNANINEMLNGTSPMLVISKKALDPTTTGLASRPLYFIVDKNGNPAPFSKYVPKNQTFQSVSEAQHAVDHQLNEFRTNWLKDNPGKHIDGWARDAVAIPDPSDPDTTYKGSYMMANNVPTSIQLVYQPRTVENGRVEKPIDGTKTVKTRTINIHKPDGTTQKVEQTVTYQQFATFDDYTDAQIGDPVWKVFTGSDETKPEDWSALTDTNHQWAAYDTPVFDNYTASQKTVLAQNVSQNDKDVTVDITYSPVIDNGTETRVLTRTITVVTPDGKQNVITQTITAQRDVTTNKATGQTVRGSWHSDNPVFAAFAAPSVQGYVPSQNVAEQTVSASDVDNWTDPQIKITYSAIPLPVDPSDNDNNKPNNDNNNKPDNKPDDNNKPAKPVKPADPAKPVKPTTPAKPNTNKNNGRASLYLAAAHAQHGTSSAKAIANAKAANAANQAKLPQTGSTSTVAVLALLATGLAAVIGLAGCRKHN
jgi:surface protein